MTGMKKVSARPLSTKKSNAAKNSKDSNNTKKTKSKQNEKTPLKMGKFDGGTLRISQKEVAKMRKQSKIATARTIARATEPDARSQNDKGEEPQPQSH